MKIFHRFLPPLTTMTRAWVGQYEVKGKAREADCLLGFSFGYRTRMRKPTPGLSNQDLANIAIKHYADMPKILQFEIADAYTESGGKNAQQIMRISKHRTPHKYLDTREVASQAQIIMKQQGWKTALLLAHPYHMPRVQAVCDSLGIKWVATPDERGAVEFDPLSQQKWTRSVDRWRGYEPLALMFYRLKGWL